jgi:hypothetical protein
MYWPRIYFMDENSDTKSVNAIDQVQDGFHGFQNGYGDDKLNIAGVAIDRKYKPRTAALPQHNWGFQ